MALGLVVLASCAPRVDVATPAPLRPSAPRASQPPASRAARNPVDRERHAALHRIRRRPHQRCPCARRAGRRRDRRAGAAPPPAARHRRILARRAGLDGTLQARPRGRRHGRDALLDCRRVGPDARARPRGRWHALCRRACLGAPGDPGGARDQRRPPPRVCGLHAGRDRRPRAAHRAGALRADARRGGRGGASSGPDDGGGRRYVGGEGSAPPRGRGRDRRPRRLHRVGATSRRPRRQSDAVRLPGCGRSSSSTATWTRRVAGSLSSPTPGTAAPPGPATRRGAGSWTSRPWSTTSGRRAHSPTQGGRRGATPAGRGSGLGPSPGSAKPPFSSPRRRSGPPLGPRGKSSGERPRRSTMRCCGVPRTATTRPSGQSMAQSRTSRSAPTTRPWRCIASSCRRTAARPPSPVSKRATRGPPLRCSPTRPDTRLG